MTSIEKQKISLESSSSTETTEITTSLVNLLDLEQRDSDGCVISQEYFLEHTVRKLSTDILEVWKLHCIIPAIKSWLEEYIVKYVEHKVRQMKLEMVLEFENKLKIIKDEHECELRRRQERDRKR